MQLKKNNNTLKKSCVVMTKIHNGSLINAALAEKVTYDAILLYQFWPERASITFYQKPCFTRLSFRRRSTPVSTVLRKSVRFFIIDILSCKASSEGRNWPNYPVWMTQKPKKGDLGKLKSKNISHWDMPLGPPKACACGARLGNRSVLILDPRLLRVFVLVSL